MAWALRVCRWRRDYSSFDLRQCKSLTSCLSTDALTTWSFWRRTSSTSCSHRPLRSARSCQSSSFTRVLRGIKLIVVNLSSSGTRDIGLSVMAPGLPFSFNLIDFVSLNIICMNFSLIYSRASWSWFLWFDSPIKISISAWCLDACIETCKMLSWII